MIDPITGALIVKEAIGAGQALKGFFDSRNAERDRPTRNEAELYDPIVAQAAQETTRELPGAERAKAGVLESQANLIEATRGAGASGGALNSMLGASEKNVGDSMLGLAERSAQFRSQNMNNYLNALGQQAQAQTRDMDWGIGENTRKINQGQALLGSGMQNVMGAGEDYAVGQFYKQTYNPNQVSPQMNNQQIVDPNRDMNISTQKRNPFMFPDSNYYNGTPVTY